MEIVDLTQEISHEQPVHPGFQPTGIFPIMKYQENPNGTWKFAVNTLLISEHIGTHVDAVHSSEKEIIPFDQVDMDQFIGSAVCLDVSQVNDYAYITLPILEEAVRKINSTLDLENKTVLLYTGLYNRYYPNKEYLDHNPGLDAEASEWLAKNGVKNIGIDAPSIDIPSQSGDNQLVAHQVCNKHGIAVTENLGDLSPVANQQFLYIGFPISVSNATASLTRSIAVLGMTQLHELIDVRGEAQ